MENLNEYLQALVSSGSTELRLEPNKEPYVISASGNTNVGAAPLQGTQISMMVFPLIPSDIKQELPDKSEIEFTHPHKLCKFEFVVKKSPAGFIVTVRPDRASAAVAVPLSPTVSSPPARAEAYPANLASAYDSETISIGGNASKARMPEAEAFKVDRASDQPANESERAAADGSLGFDLRPSEFIPPVEEYIPEPEPDDVVEEGREIAAVQLVERRKIDRREVNSIARDRMDALFRKMADVEASDLHLSAGVPPIVRKDGKMNKLECDEAAFEPDVIRELLFSIMPPKNREEFTKRNDTDFAYEIPGLARFRCNAFTDRKGAGGVFRMIPTKILTAEQLGLSKAVMNLCSLSKGLVIVTGTAGSGRSTTLCAMVDSINRSRENHIITIEDPIEFIHENKNCLVNQREVNNHTDSFKVAMRAALREDPDVLLVGEMRDLDTVSMAIEAAEKGHLVFGTLHTTTAASTVDRIIDQFPADRQQQVRVMLSETLRGVIAQTLLPIKGGGRVAAMEVLVVTPAISDLIREGKTSQIPWAMQTGEDQGMVMLNDALLDLVQQGIVEPRDAYAKAVDKDNFEAVLSEAGMKI